MSGKGGVGLLGRLRGDRDEGGALWIEELGPAERADFGRLKRELRVLESAQDDGRRNQPAATATAPAGTELQIVGRIAQGLRDLNYFRRRHNLHRAASYRESTLLPFAVLVGAFVIESFANAFLLRRISEQGWVGGVVLASVISIVNIALGVVGGGVGWRLVGHRFPAQRALGWGVSVAALLLAFFWNIYAAHFREVAEQAVDTGTNASLAGHAVDALAHIRAHGLLGLSSLFSWGLFALGLLVHLAASREAWDDMADRYWDYRRYDRAYRTARLDYEDAVAAARADAVEASREVLAELEAQYAPATQDRDRLLALAELAQRRLSEGRDAEAEWVRQGGALVKAYRDENAQVRSDPAPAYFARPLAADVYRHGVGGAAPAATAELEASRANAERADAAIRADAERAHHVHGDTVAALASLRAYVTEAADALQARIDALKTTIDREADANLNRRATVADDAPSPPPVRDAEPPRFLEEPGDALGPLERVGGP